MRRVLFLSLSILLAVAIISCSSKSSVSRIDDGAITIDVPIDYNDSVQFPSTSRLFALFRENLKGYGL